GGELPGLQHELHDLVPGHLLELEFDRQVGRDAGVDVDVDAADLGQVAQHGAQIRALIVHVDERGAESAQRTLRRRTLWLGGRGHERRGQGQDRGCGPLTKHPHRASSPLDCRRRWTFCEGMPASTCSANHTPCSSMLTTVASRSLSLGCTTYDR